MTLQEALKTGKPFKRDGWRHFRQLVKVTGGYAIQICSFKIDRAYQSDNMLINDILADDWEIKE